jgi:pimeloyl-ACP methyl ester carboxylesterase
MDYFSKFILIISLIVLAWPIRIYSSQEDGEECVILLHGLARTKYSMNKMERRLTAAEYQVINFDYPSRKHTIEELADKIIPEAIELCRSHNSGKVHFVTHSLGGIILRYYLQQHKIPDLGKVVMLSPPNKGSEVVDKLKNNFLFKALNGPAGGQLGTEETSIPIILGKADFELGVITGDRSINFINSSLIPGDDDGKVSVERAKVEGMRDFLLIHTSHPFIMKNNEAIEQTINFLKKGKFSRSSK